MSKKYLIANWKMHKIVEEALCFMHDFLSKVGHSSLPIELYIAPSFVHLHPMQTLIQSAPIKLAAQNCHYEVEGAFTGEVSAAMLAAIGVEGVIIGHSERRKQEVHLCLPLRIKQVLAAGMRPIFCCGEGLSDRNTGNHLSILSKQIEAGLEGLTVHEAAKIIIAYEPVWAIGTGRVADVAVITETHTYIREILVNTYGPQATDIPIIYGGSCNEHNAVDIFACPNVAGGLIGNASLQVDSFLKIMDILLKVGHSL